MASNAEQRPPESSVRRGKAIFEARTQQMSWQIHKESMSEFVAYYVYASRETAYEFMTMGHNGDSVAVNAAFHQCVQYVSKVAGITVDPIIHTSGRGS